MNIYIYLDNVNLKDFELGLKASPLYFTLENIMQIIAEAPKSANK